MTTQQSERAPRSVEYPVQTAGDLGEWRADPWRSGRIDIRAANFGCVCQVNAHMDPNPDFGTTGKVFAKVIEAAPNFALGVSYMLHAEQSGGDLWWHGWGILKEAFVRTGLEHDSPNYEAAVNSHAGLLARVKRLEEALRDACTEIKDLRHDLNNNGGMYDDEEYTEGLAVLNETKGI